MSTIGENIQHIRESRGLTLGQLAIATGCHKSSIYNWENGTCQPQLENACDLAEALHTTVEVLCGRAEYCPSKQVADLKRENVRLRKILAHTRERLIYDLGEEIRAELFPEKLKGE